MGGCCSKSTAINTMPPAPNDHQSDLKSLPPPPPQHEKKKEIFVIKHRISHDDGTNATFNSATNTTTATSSCKGEEFDDDNNLNLRLQCGGSGSRLSRSNSTTRLHHNPNRKRSCRSNSSVDFDNLYYRHDDDDHPIGRGRGVSATRNNSSSRSSSKERRISISPSRTTTRRRSESPFRNLNTTTTAVSSNPIKMVSVPATNKTSEEVVVKRIHVKRNVSPAKTRAADLRVFTDQHLTNTDNTREVDRLYYTRKSLVEIDNNAAMSTQLGKRMRKLSRDMNQETQFDDPSTGPPSYATLLLEDIHKFHQNNPNVPAAAASTAPPAFVLPECVTKARSIMEAVADLTSNTSSLCSDDRYRNLTVIEHQVKEEQESGTVVVNGVSVSAGGDQPPSQEEPTSDDFKVRGLGGFQKDFVDYPRKGTGHSRRSAYSFPKTTTAALA